MLEGEAVRMGVAEPARSMRSGLVSESLSMVRTPASLVGAGRQFR